MASTQQLAAEVTRSSGAKEDVTADTTWTSGTPAVATVSAAGLVTAVAVGTSEVTGTYQGKSGKCTVTVADTVTGLAVTPGTAPLDLSGA